ncbi:hypothetical protein B0J17DRAFT_634386 [Rhizoctonia solani]|nr:hypothetical protein B0J17DRAFT_634386 [Rhizoctonia solani]
MSGYWPSVPHLGSSLTSKIGPKLRDSVSASSDELIAHILHLCNYRDILRFAELHVELEVHGLEVISGSGKGNVNFRQIPEELRGYHEAWLDLEFNKPVVRLMKGGILKWKLEQGCFAAVTLDLAGLSRDCSLELVPQDDSAVPGAIKLDQPVHEFHVDPSQDLVDSSIRDPGNETDSLLQQKAICSSKASLDAEWAASSACSPPCFHYSG